MERFRLMVDDVLTGYENMARDEALLESVHNGISPPVVRFYRWAPPGLSIGYLQRIEEEVDLSVCRRCGVDCVRRLTGGKSVLHDDELTYSIVIPSSHGTLDGIGIVDSYLSISRGLIRSLSLLGVDASVAKGESDAPGPPSSSVCFEMPSIYEILSGGKKIIGSAQTRRKGTILQHGSVPISWRMEKMLALMGIPEGQREHHRAILKERATTLSEIQGARIEFEDLVPCFVQGFEDAFGIELVPSTYTASELKTAGDLALNKYGSDEWNLKR